MKASDYGNLLIANDYRAVVANLRGDIQTLIKSRGSSTGAMAGIFREILTRGDAVVRHVRRLHPDSPEDELTAADAAGLSFFDGVREACSDLNRTAEFEFYLAETENAAVRRRNYSELNDLYKELKKLPDGIEKTILMLSARIELRQQLRGLTS